MMLLRADPSSQTISLLSLPRDLVVPIYCGKSSYPVDHGRINSAYAICGSTGSLETVRHLTGVPINYLISVNFSGFVATVDKLGGVWMDVDRRYYNKNVGTFETNYANIDLQPGYQLMNGREALEFVRFRHTDSDLYRLARQQEFVSAMRQQAAHSLGPTSIVRIINTIAHHHYVEIARGGHGIDLNTIYSYAKFAYGLPAGHVFQTKLTQVTGTNELFASQSSVEGAVQDFLNPDVESAKTNTAVALGRKLKKKFVLAPSKTTLTVLNGNGVAGSASNGSYLLGQKGYKVLVPASGQPANAPTWNYFHSKAYFDPARAACKGAAQGVARLVGSTDVEPIGPKLKNGNLWNGACVTLVVGSTFHNSLAPVSLPQAPVRQPPHIAGDGGVTRAAMVKYKKRLPFRLEYPSVIASGSQLDTGYGETPVRVYQLGGQPTIRLTYRFGLNQYWGIQETAWNAAPILADKSLTQRVGKRRFDLYYNSGHLHMVVLRTGGATYWVVNSLLDELSNETMLAIARGFRPMTR
jgi:LCP family protein required for cell wall assembly